MTDHRMDWHRATRTGTAEAVFCAGKSDDQILAILEEARAEGHNVLLTRLSAQQHARLGDAVLEDYDAISQTAIYGALPEARPGIGVVAAGTSDMPVATEAARTLAFHGFAAPVLADVGVAGLWRLLDHVETLRSYKVLIAVAGMEGALFSVLTGLVAAPVIAVPSPKGYGVAENGHLALHAALGSCSPGLTVVNIGNGFGAACAAVRIMGVGAAR